MTSGIPAGGGGTPPAPPAGRTTIRAADELADLLRPALVVARRRLPEVVVGIALVVTLSAVLAFVGATLDDRMIDANPGVAQAEVLDGSSWDRTLVRFTTATGETVLPALGVYYPGGLAVGQTVAVEYDTTDPDHVRVAGRTALSGLPALLLIAAGTWVVLGPLALWLGRRRARRTAPAP
jgi:uncharacterized protein DUF3592